MALTEDDKAEINRLIVVHIFQLSEIKRMTKKSKSFSISFTSFVVGALFTLMILGIWSWF